ncbi:hypothetical protein [Dysgonomonas termitidis]|uniref:Uncharacterized protein n=1 Tax=Dysgonomonas termitidis TaxID=1516126 RepID=A0ABV9L2Q1_9BACT
MKIKGWLSNIRNAKRLYIISLIDITVLDILGNHCWNNGSGSEMNINKVIDLINSEIGIYDTDLIYKRIEYLIVLDYIEKSHDNGICISPLGRSILANQQLHISSNSSFFAYSNYIFMGIAVIIALISLFISMISILLHKI